MPTQEQLTHVLAAFSQWRSNKKYLREPTPAKLREMALIVSHQLPSSNVAAALKISNQQLASWRNKQSPTTHVNPFIELPVLTAPDNKMTVEVCFVRGEQLRLSGDIDAQLLTTLVRAIKL